jgi:hypothetical protein
MASVAAGYQQSNRWPAAAAAARRQAVPVASAGCFRSGHRPILRGPPARVTGGKPYYLGGMFSVLLVAGAQPAVDWIGRGRARLRAGLVTAAVILTLTAIP